MASRTPSGDWPKCFDFQATAEAALALVNGIQNRKDLDSPCVNGNSQTLEPSFKENNLFKRRTHFRKEEVVNIKLF